MPPVAAYMTSVVEIARPDTRLREVLRRLEQGKISALPIVDGTGELVGVVSRFDLVRHQRHHPRALDDVCADVMTRQPITTGVGASLAAAARAMVQHRIHRVLVVDGGRLAGVLTTSDLTRAVDDARLAHHLDTIMSSPVATVRTDQRLGLAMEWLDRAHISGLVVTEDDWPVGVFAQEDALAARHLPPEAELAALYDPSLVCLPRDTPLHQAAGLCVRMGVRRVVVSHQRDYVGIVTGLDFAGAIARSDQRLAS
ncbi:MAG TPA: CBS domain-containing protein [Kofleriaceae bacterium]|nr:CBS domain-containing protein [Kofleriaceae bacterium]